VWAGSQVVEENVRLGGFMRVAPQELVKNLRDGLKLNGSGETFRNLFWYEGSILVVTLALVGAQLIGNDFRHRSLPFYLSKPLAGRHYIAGKCLAVAVVVAAMTGLPALCLYVEYGLLDSWEYFWEARRSLFGILGYGLLLCGMMSLLLVAVTSWVQKTVPLVMVWSGLFVMAPAVGQSLAAFSNRPMYRLIDLWDCAYIVGNAMLGTKVENQPPPWAAATVIAFVCMMCIAMLYTRIRAVEIV
jgi:ABC-2 type transport system permease protein